MQYFFSQAESLKKYLKGCSKLILKLDALLIGLIGMVRRSVYTMPANLSLCHVSPIEKITDTNHLNECVAHLTSQQPHVPLGFPSVNCSVEAWPLGRTTPSGIQDLSTQRSIRFIIRSRSVSMASLIFVPLAALVSK